MSRNDMKACYHMIEKGQSCPSFFFTPKNIFWGGRGGSDKDSTYLMVGRFEPVRELRKEKRYLSATTHILTFL